MYFQVVECMRWIVIIDVLPSHHLCINYYAINPAHSELGTFIYVNYSRRSSYCMNALNNCTECDTSRPLGKFLHAYGVEEPNGMTPLLRNFPKCLDTPGVSHRKPNLQ
jgi:hypothetical protein